MRILPPKVPALIAFVYFCFGALWILASDALVHSVSNGNAAVYEAIQTAKGGLFVFLSTGLVFAGAAWAIRSRDSLLAERLKFEETLAVAQRMEAFGSLAATIVHDINNMLTVIRMATELAKIKNGSAQEKDVVLREIDSASSQAQKTVGRLMQFISNRSQTMQHQDVGAIIRNSEGLLCQAASSSVEVTFTIPGNLPHTCCDSGLIEQTLVNLFANARDATAGRPQRQIDLVVEALKLDRYQSAFSAIPRSGEFVVVEVSDSGEGIPPGDEVKIFNPLFTTKPVGKGTGLGLASAWRSMEKHGGWIEVKSRPGSGATFRLLFPVRQDAAGGEGEGRD